jgi:asparagine synthase (glutamine-hydrolysing)
MPETILLGKPRFTDSDLAKIAASDGIEAAWRAAFGRYGADAPARAAGDFAVAVDVDGKTWLAVDRFAMRTLCYRTAGGRLSAAARADALADAGALDPQAIFDYFYLHAIASPRTVFKDVFRLPPAHAAVFEDGHLTVAPYWTPRFDEDRATPFDARRDEFRRLLRQAVERQLDGGKAGCFLSGGTDSSTVAGMIGLVRGAPAATYSIGFEARGYDEMAYARIAARRFGTEHHEYYVTPANLVESIPKVAAHYDQPFGNSSALPAYYCARLARADGVTRLLAGDGGDELFGGNSRYAKSRLFDFYRHVPGILRAGLLEPLFGAAPAARLPLLRKGASYVEQARTPMPRRLEMYNLVMRLGLADTMTPEFLAQVDASAPLAGQQAVWNAAATDSALNRELAFDWRYTLAESDLPKVAGTASLAGLDVGYPMLDDDVLAFSLRLPPGDKLRGLKLRWFFKEALRGFLPDEILVKKKQGFGLPFGVWAVQDAALRALAADSVRALAARRILRADFVETLFARRLHEHPAYFGEMIWISMMLEQWLRAHAPGFSV